MRRPALLAALAAAIVLATVPALGPGDVAHARPGDPPVAPVSVSVDALGPAGPTVPGDFLGLSLEKRVLATSQTDARYGNLAGLLRSLGSGTLRFGGDTVETTAYVGSRSTRPPTWAGAVVTPADYDRLVTLTGASGWRVVLGVNLGHYDPQRAADEAAAASARLGPALMAIEVGNEPNAYIARGLRDDSYTPDDYQREFESYRQAISAVVPGVPVVGPASYPLPYLNAFDPGFAVPDGFVSQHLYPLNRVTATRQVYEMGMGLAVAQAHAMPLRIAETNSVICSGTPGVSNTLGSALWSIDYLMQASSRGIAGVNMHGGIQACGAGTSPWYTPLCAAGSDALATNTFTAQPIWYGMQLMSRLAGTSFVQTSYNTAQNLVVRATRDPAGTVRVAIDDMDPPGTADSLVRLDLPPGFDTGQVARLLGPSVDATSGVTLGNAAVAPDGSLTPAPTEPVTGRAGITYVRVTAGSAALVTLVPACTVPAVGGLTLPLAKDRLSSGGCKAGIVSKPKVKPGTALVVRRQALPAGFRYRLGQPVHLQLVAKPQPRPKPFARR